MSQPRPNGEDLIEQSGSAIRRANFRLPSRESCWNSMALAVMGDQEIARIAISAPIDYWRTARSRTMIAISTRRRGIRAASTKRDNRRNVPEHQTVVCIKSSRAARRRRMYSNSRGDHSGFARPQAEGREPIRSLLG